MVASWFCAKANSVHSTAAAITQLANSPPTLKPNHSQMKPLKDTKLAALFFRVKAYLDEDETGTGYLVVFGILLFVLLRVIFGPDYADLFIDKY